MVKLQSIFESKEGNIIRLGEIVYIDVKHTTVHMNGGRVIIFHSEEKECFLRCKEAYKNLRNNIDEVEQRRNELDIDLYNIKIENEKLIFKIKEM